MTPQSRIANIQVQVVCQTTGELKEERVACETFWKNGTSCVIIFFDRFGSKFSRLSARELSNIIMPTLKKNNIRFIGIGFDAKHLKTFVQGNVFDGELYVDSKKQCFKALQFKRLSVFEVVRGDLAEKWRSAAKIAKKISLGGDGCRIGGVLIVDKNGKLLYEYDQKDTDEKSLALEMFQALNLKRCKTVRFCLIEPTYYEI